MPQARLFRDRFLAPLGLTLGSLPEDRVVAYRRELVEAGYAVTTIGTTLSVSQYALCGEHRATKISATPWWFKERKRLHRRPATKC